MKNRIIISLYDVSSPLSEVYKRAGYTVLRYDATRGTDCRMIEYPDFAVHGVISHSPCTHFAGSGARWWAGKGETAILEGLSTIDATCRIILLKAPKFWVLENPVGRLPRWLGRPRFIFQPHEFGGWLNPIGDEYTKRTCLWGNFNIPEKRAVPNRLGSIVHMMSGSDGPGQGKRNLFPEGFARAFFEVNQ